MTFCINGVKTMNKKFADLKLDMDEELYQRVLDCAKQRNISFDEMLCDILKRGIERFEKEHPIPPVS